MENIRRVFLWLVFFQIICSLVDPEDDSMNTITFLGEQPTKMPTTTGCDWWSTYGSVGKRGEATHLVVC